MAVNLSGIDREDVVRGDTLTTAGWLEPSRRVAARLGLLPGAPSPLGNLARVHFHYGTAETIARVVLLEGDELAQGQTALARLSMQDPVVLSRGDRFIIRSYSPVTTIGGGSVIASPSSHRRKSREAISDLLARERGDPQSDLLLALSKAPYVFSQSALAKRLGLTDEATSALLKASGDADRTRMLGGGHVSTAVLDSLVERILSTAKSYLDSRPLRLSVGKEELRNLAAPELDSRTFGLLLYETERRSGLVVSGERLSVPGRTCVMPERLANALREASRRLESSRYSPPDIEQVAAGIGLDAAEEADLLLRLTESGQAVRLADNLIMSAQAVEEARAALVLRLAEKGTITVSEFRDLLGTSRKFALPLLEYFDQIKVTRRSGDARILYGQGR